MAGFGAVHLEFMLVIHDLAIEHFGTSLRLSPRERIGEISKRHWYGTFLQLAGFTMRHRSSLASLEADPDLGSTIPRFLRPATRIWVGIDEAQARSLSGCEPSHPSSVPSDPALSANRKIASYCCPVCA